MEYLNIILNALLILLVVVPMLVGAKKGFVQTAFSFGRLLGAILLSTCFCKRVALMMRDWVATNLIGDRIHRFFETGSSYVTSESLTSAVPSGLQSVLALFGFDLNALAEQAVAEGQNMAVEFADTLTVTAASVLSVVIAFAALLLVSWLLLGLLGKLLDAIVKKIPVLKQANTVLGAAVGLLLGLSYAWAGAQVMVALLGLLLHIDYTAYPLIAFFYEINPLALIFKSIMTAMSGIAVA